MKDERDFVPVPRPITKTPASHKPLVLEIVPGGNRGKVWGVILARGSSVPPWPILTSTWRDLRRRRRWVRDKESTASCWAARSGLNQAWLRKMACKCLITAAEVRPWGLLTAGIAF